MTNRKPKFDQPSPGLVATPVGNLLFTVPAITRAAKASGKSWRDLAAAAAEWDGEALQYLFWAGLLHERPTLTLEEAEALLATVPAFVAVKAIADAVYWATTGEPAPDLSVEPRPNAHAPEPLPGQPSSPSGSGSSG